MHPMIRVFVAGDAKNEVPVTNLAKIEFPGKNKNESKLFKVLKISYVAMSVMTCHVSILYSFTQHNTSYQGLKYSSIPDHVGFTEDTI